jgi:hypothetical protein
MARRVDDGPSAENGSRSVGPSATWSNLRLFDPRNKFPPARNKFSFPGTENVLPPVSENVLPGPVFHPRNRYYLFHPRNRYYLYI